MKKYWPTALLVLGIGVTLAALLGHFSGRACDAGIDSWHFVEDRTSDRKSGLPSATWSSRDSCRATRSNQ